MDIEAHTLTHPDLTVVPPAQAWNEIRGSRSALQRHLGRRVDIFAYPYGSFNARVLADVRRAGYAAAFTTEQGWILKQSQRFLLPRVYVDRDDSIAQFAGRLTGNLAVVSRDPT
jgi:peptidoglycan/xylan/chitin deacetylase (PgdA/CDA1 family)